MAERVPECLDDREPPFPVLEFLAPKWRHVDPATPLVELRGAVAPVEGTEAESLPPRARFNDSWTDATLVFGTAGEIVTVGSTVALFGAVTPDKDWSLFITAPGSGGEPNRLARNRSNHRNEHVLRRVVKRERNIFGFESVTLEEMRDPQMPDRFIPIIECEINTPKALDRVEGHSVWAPPLGREVRVYGDWVEDVSHDRKTEIHPIHWITWRQHIEECASCYRVTVMTDVSGRLPAVDIAARIEYLVSEVAPALPAGRAVTCRVVLRDRDASNPDARCQQVGDRFIFTCTVPKWTGKKAGNCNTTERDTNQGGFWDGWIWFDFGEQGVPGGADGGSGSGTGGGSGGGAPSGAGSAGGGSPLGPTPGRPAQPRVVVRSTEVLEGASGELTRSVRLFVETSVEKFDPQADRVHWTLVHQDVGVPLPLEVLAGEVEVAIPVSRPSCEKYEVLGALDSGQEAGPQLISTDWGDPGLLPLQVFVAVEQGDSCLCNSIAFEINEPAVTITERWSLVSSSPRTSEELGTAVLRLQLAANLDAALEPGVEYRWRLYSPQCSELSSAASVATEIRYRPTAGDSGFYVARVEIFSGNRRLGTGSRVMEIPRPAVSLMSQSENGATTVFAKTSNLYGELKYSWLLGDLSGQAEGTLSVSGNSIRFPSHLDSGAVSVVVTDSIGQKALRGFRIAEFASDAAVPKPPPAHSGTAVSIREGSWALTPRNREAILFQAWTTAVQSQEYLIFRVSNDGPDVVVVSIAAGAEPVPLQPGQTRDLFPASLIKLSLPGSGEERAHGRYDLLCCGGDRCRGHRAPLDTASAQDTPAALTGVQIAELAAVLPPLARNNPGQVGGFDGVCDANGLTFLGTLTSGQTRTIELQGRWKPGATHQYVAPEGNPVLSLHGVNKWCALVLGMDGASGRILYAYPYQRSPLTCMGTAQAGVELYVLMNDDLYGDNANDLNDPMRVV